MLLGLIGHIRNSDKAIDSLLDHLQPLRLLIRRKDREPLVRIHREISTECCRTLLRILPTVDIGADHQSPRKLLNKLRDTRLQRLQELLAVFLADIFDVRPDHGIRIDLFLRYDDISDIHTVLRTHRDISVVIHSLNHAGQTNGIKILAGQIPSALFRFLEQKQNLFTFMDSTRHIIIKEVLLEGHRDVRENNHIINRNTNHWTIPPSPYRQ